MGVVARGVKPGGSLIRGCKAPTLHRLVRRWAAEVHLGRCKGRPEGRQGRVANARPVGLLQLSPDVVRCHGCQPVDSTSVEATEHWDYHRRRRRRRKRATAETEALPEIAVPAVPAAAGSTRATKEAAEEMAKAEVATVVATVVATADMEAAILLKNGKKGTQGVAGSRAS